MTIKEVKNKAKFLCNHVDPGGRPIVCYYDNNDDMYYITYNAKVTRDKEEYVTSKKGCDIKDNVLFDPFSELKCINNK